RSRLPAVSGCRSGFVVRGAAPFRAQYQGRTGLQTTKVLKRGSCWTAAETRLYATSPQPHHRAGLSALRPVRTDLVPSIRPAYPRRVADGSANRVPRPSGRETRFDGPGADAARRRLTIS